VDALERVATGFVWCGLIKTGNMDFLLSDSEDLHHMTAAPVAAEDRNLAPVSVALPPDQVSWLDDHARSNRISRSAVVRQAIDRLMRQQRHSLS